MTFDGAAQLITSVFEDALTDSVDVYRNTPGAVDDFGNPAESWALLNTEPALVKQPSASDERIDEERTFRRKVVFLRASADVVDTDRILYGGRYYFIVAVETVMHGTVAHRLRLTIEQET